MFKEVVAAKSLMLDSNDFTQYLDEWPQMDSKYHKQHEVCVPG